MLYADYDPEEEMAVVREEGREEGQLYVLELLNQGLTIDEIKQQLDREKGLL